MGLQIYDHCDTLQRRLNGNINGCLHPGMVQPIPIMCQIYTVDDLAMAVVWSIALVGPWQAHSWINIVSGLLSGIVTDALDDHVEYCNT
jgi:hypothetical protein